MSEHDELESSVAAWVLGAVDEADAERVRLHVEGCAECQATIAELRRAAGALALGTDATPPPAWLRDRILATSHLPAERGSPLPAERGGRSGEAAPGGGDGQPRAVPLRWRKRQQSLRRIWRLPQTAVAAVVAIALLAGLLIGDAVGRLTAPPPPSQVARFTLEGHGPMQGASATVIDLKSEGVALVTFSRLPPEPAGKVYELWLITAANRADPAGVFLPDVNGQSLVVVAQSLAAYKLMAVTVENAPSGARSPTQPPEIYGNIA